MHTRARAVVLRSAVRWRAAVVLALVAPIALWAPAASGELAWIKDELVLKLRSLPGNDAFVLGTVKTGDSVQVMRRRGAWAQVRESSWRDLSIPLERHPGPCVS